jgi:hypothetical protein
MRGEKERRMFRVCLAGDRSRLGRKVDVICKQVRKVDVLLGQVES